MTARATPRSLQGVSVSRAPSQPAELLTAEPFLGWWAVDEGLLTSDQLRSSAWRRVLRGVYVPDIVSILASLYFILGDIDR